jgi:rhamnosyltransferase
MKCSIVIRAYNEEKHIGRLLEGIRQQTVKDVEIILVDSGSTDETVFITESFSA